MPRTGNGSATLCVFLCAASAALHLVAQLYGPVCDLRERRSSEIIETLRVYILTCYFVLAKLSSTLESLSTLVLVSLYVLYLD